MANNVLTKAKYLLRRRKMTVRAMSSFAKFLTGQKPLRTVHIAPSWTCNAGCPHCNATPFLQKEREEMTVEEWKTVIGQSIKLGALNFVFQGGEPLLYPNICELISEISDKGGYPVVNTNGILLSEMIGPLKKAGLEWINVSINGIGVKHDSFYGHPGLFEKALEGIESALKSKLNVIVITVATNESLESGETLKIAEFFSEKNIDTWLVYPMAVGKWHGDESVSLTPANLKRFDELLKYKFIHWEGEGNYMKFGCPAGAEIIYVSAYGDVTPCASIYLSYGNVKNSSLKDILSKMRKNKYFGGIQRRCIVSADKEFYSKYIAPLAGVKGTVTPEQLEAGKNLFTTPCAGESASCGTGCSNCKS